MNRVSSIAAIVCLCSVGQARALDSAGDHMFGRLLGLVGDWEGTYEWSQGRAGSGPLKATYHLTANGSAVVEDLVMGGVPTMTSVYHMDGPDLRMTHYCGARNQPRLKAARIDEAAGEVEFAFVDATNVGTANPGHVDGFLIRMVDGNTLNLQFSFSGGGKSAIEHIKLKRVTPLSPPATTP